MHYAKDQDFIVAKLGYTIETGKDRFTVEYKNKKGELAVIEKIDDETGASVAYEQGVDRVGAPLDSVYRYDPQGERHGRTIKYDTCSLTDARYPRSEYYWHGEMVHPVTYFMNSRAESVKRALQGAKALMIDDTKDDLKKAGAAVSRFVKEDSVRAFQQAVALMLGTKTAGKFFSNKKDVEKPVRHETGLQTRQSYEAKRNVIG